MTSAQHVSKKRKRQSEGGQHKSFHSEEGDFFWRSIKMDIPLAPVHAGNLRAGITEVLERWLTRYIPSLGFVLLGIDHATLSLPKTARVLPPTAMALVRGVTFNAFGWRPTMGSKLRGRILHSTRSNVSLILYGTFNATIDASQLPSDSFMWDPEMVSPVQPIEQEEEDDFYKEMYRQEEEEVKKEEGSHEVTEGLSELALQQRQMQAESQEQQEHVLGCWVDRSTNRPVGDQDGMLEFTVVGLTIANSTVTVVGSLSSQPFILPPSQSTLLVQQQQASPPQADNIDIDTPPAPSSASSEKKKKKKKKHQKE